MNFILNIYVLTDLQILVFVWIHTICTQTHKHVNVMPFFIHDPISVLWDLAVILNVSTIFFSEDPNTSLAPNNPALKYKAKNTQKLLLKSKRNSCFKYFCNFIQWSGKNKLIFYLLMQIMKSFEIQWTLKYIFNGKSYWEVCTCNTYNIFICLPQYCIFRGHSSMTLVRQGGDWNTPNNEFCWRGNKGDGGVSQILTFWSDRGDFV